MVTYFKMMCRLSVKLDDGLDPNKMNLINGYLIMSTDYGIAIDYLVIHIQSYFSSTAVLNLLSMTFSNIASPNVSFF